MSAQRVGKCTLLRGFIDLLICHYFHLCSKTYTSENGYYNHMQSKKHREMQVKQEIMGMHPQRKPVQVGPLFSDISDISDQSDLEDEHNTITGCKDPAGTCIFCLFPSKNLDDNIEHMCRVHGFFLPDCEYLVDQRGLILYLADKIEHDYICLYCNGRGKEYKNPQAVRAHMVSIHCIWIILMLIYLLILD